MLHDTSPCLGGHRERPGTRDVDGHGLGLAIVKRLVERAGGTEVES